MTDTEALCPPLTHLTLAGRSCQIKPLSLKETIELGRILGQLHSEVLANIKEGSTQAVTAKIFELAGSNKLNEMLNILTHNQLKDIKNLDSHLSLLEVSGLIKIVGEVNDFSLIMLNFKQALKGISK